MTLVQRLLMAISCSKLLLHCSNAPPMLSYMYLIVPCSLVAALLPCSLVVVLRFLVARLLSCFIVTITMLVRCSLAQFFGIFSCTSAPPIILIITTMNNRVQDVCFIEYCWKLSFPYLNYGFNSVRNLTIHLDKPTCHMSQIFVYP